MVEELNQRVWTQKIHDLPGADKGLLMALSLVWLRSKILGWVCCLMSSVSFGYLGRRFDAWAALMFCGGLKHLRRADALVASRCLLWRIDALAANRYRKNVIMM